MHVCGMSDDNSYLQWSIDNLRRHLESPVPVRSLASVPYLIHWYNADSSHSPLDTKLVAIDALANIPDYPDAGLSDPWGKTYRLHCNWRTSTTYTTRPTDGHYAAVSWNENGILNTTFYIVNLVNLHTLTGSNNFRQWSTVSLVSFCEIIVRSSITRHSIRLIRRGRHNRLANSSKLRHFTAEMGGIWSVYR